MVIVFLVVIVVEDVMVGHWWASRLFWRIEPPKRDRLLFLSVLELFQLIEHTKQTLSPNPKHSPDPNPWTYQKGHTGHTRMPLASKLSKASDYYCYGKKENFPMN